MPNAVDIVPEASKSGFVYQFNETDLRMIKDLNLDVLVRCGSGILTGDILQATRFGILSFYHAENRVNRGGPPGFWEVYLKQPHTGFTIQQLTDELDCGNVLLRGRINTRFCYLLNQAALYKKVMFL